MKKIILLFVLFFNLIPNVRDDGFSFFLTSSYAQSFGDEDGDDGEICERDGEEYMGEEDCNEVWYMYTVQTNCATDEIIGDYTNGHEEYFPIPGCGEDDDDDDWPEYRDCAGDINGSAYMADCGCIGGSTGIYECPPEEEDCNGDPGGSAYMADCGCIGGNTGIYECPPLQTDCNGDIGGSAYMTPCGCIGGNTIYRECITDPCDTKSQLAAAALNDVYFDNSEVNDALTNPLFAPPPLGGPPTNEKFFTLTKDSFGNYDVPQIESGGPNAAIGTTYTNSVANFHTHPNSDHCPSATDVSALLSANSYASNLNMSFVVTGEGTRYALMITDETKAMAFFSANGPSVDTTTHNWISTTSIGTDFLTARLYFVNTGLSLSESYERSMAVVLKDSGISLFKAPSVTPPFPDTTFKKIGVNEAVDSFGNTIFTYSDCP